MFLIMPSCKFVVLDVLLETLPCVVGFGISLPYFSCEVVSGIFLGEVLGITAQIHIICYCFRLVDRQNHTLSGQTG